MRLAGKVALVTGGSRGIGAAVARALAREGARVTLTFRTERARAAALAAEIGGEALELDVRQAPAVRAAVRAVVTRQGRLDVLVNNAGWLQQKDFFEIDDDDFAQAIAVNLHGPFVATQEAGLHFRARPGGGAIVNVSSIGAQFGGPKAPHYAAAKAALVTFTRSSARLLAPYGVRVNALAPGFVRTEMIAGVLARDGEENIARDIPLGRIGEPEDVAAAAVFLASDESAFVTGQVLGVNGGQWMG